MPKVARKLREKSGRQIENIEEHTIKPTPRRLREEQLPEKQGEIQKRTKETQERHTEGEKGKSRVKRERMGKASPHFIFVGKKESRINTPEESKEKCQPEIANR